MIEIDNLIAGFVGGFIGCGLVLMSYCQWIEAKSRQYLSAKRAMKDAFAISGLEHDVRDLNVEMREIRVAMSEMYDLSAIHEGKSK